MGDLNYSAEKEGSEPVDLAEKEKDLGAAIDAQIDSSLEKIDAGGTPDFGSSSSSEADVTADVITSTVSTKISTVTTATTVMSSGSKGGGSAFFPGAGGEGGGPAAGAKSSFFGDGPTGSPVQAKGSAFVPLSYADKKRVMKEDNKAEGKAYRRGEIKAGGGSRGSSSISLSERMSISSMSTTGASLIGGGAKGSGMKGADVRNAAISLGLVDKKLVDRLNQVTYDKNGGLEMTANRIDDMMKKGNFDKVNDFAKNSPSSNMMQSLQMNPIPT